MSGGELSVPVELPERLQRDFHLPGTVNFAAASRNLENAQAFALERNIPRFWKLSGISSIGRGGCCLYRHAPLFPCRKCDSMHENQKAVLGEKPFAVNAKEVES